MYALGEILSFTNFSYVNMTSLFLALQKCSLHMKRGIWSKYITYILMSTFGLKYQMLTNPLRMTVHSTNSSSSTKAYSA